MPETLLGKEERDFSQYVGGNEYGFAAAKEQPFAEQFLRVDQVGGYLGEDQAHDIEGLLVVE